MGWQKQEKKGDKRITVEAIEIEIAIEIGIEKPTAFRSTVSPWGGRGYHVIEEQTAYGNGKNDYDPDPDPDPDSDFDLEKDSNLHRF